MKGDFSIDTTAIYKHSAAHAREHGELEQYRASHRANVACAAAIEQAIRDNYRDNLLAPAAVAQVTTAFGQERVDYVLANTVQQQSWDLRFSRDNRAWAETISVAEDTNSWGDDRRRDFIVSQHSGLVDLFVTQARRDREKTSLRAQLQQPAPPLPTANGKEKER